MHCIECIKRQGQLELIEQLIVELNAPASPLPICDDRVMRRALEKIADERKNQRQGLVAGLWIRQAKLAAALLRCECKIPLSKRVE